MATGAVYSNPLVRGISSACRIRLARMRAVIYDKYGAPDVLRLEEVERPVPKDDEVLVKIHATTVTRTDCGLRSAEIFISRFVTGLLRLMFSFPGMELAGVLSVPAPRASEFEVGDH